MTVPYGFVEVPNKSPYFAHLGPFYFKKDEQGYAMGLQTGTKHLRGAGFIAGPVVFALADFSMGHAVARALWSTPEEMRDNQIRLVSIGSTIDFIASPSVDVWIESQVDVIKTGKNVCFAQCVVRNTEQVFARASGTFIVRS